MAQNRVPLIGYVRVSSVAGRLDERFQSPALQREVMERWATLCYGKNGHRWLDWLTDLDRSDVTIDRPALNKARDLAVAERASIVVYDLTRYSRSVPEGLSALERLAADDVRVLSASEDLDATTPEGRAEPHDVPRHVAVGEDDGGRTHTSEEDGARLPRRAAVGRIDAFSV